MLQKEAASEVHLQRAFFCKAHLIPCGLTSKEIAKRTGLIALKSSSA